MSQDTSSNTATMASTERNTIPFVEADMENGCESGACGLAKAFYDSQCRLLWRLKTRGELSTFYRSTFDSWAPEEVKSNPGLHRQFAQVMFALVNDGQILRVNKGQYLVWTDPQNPANRRRNQGHRRGQQGPHRGCGHRVSRDLIAATGEITVIAKDLVGFITRAMSAPVMSCSRKAMNLVVEAVLAMNATTGIPRLLVASLKAVLLGVAHLRATGPHQKANSLTKS